MLDIITPIYQHDKESLVRCAKSIIKNCNFVTKWILITSDPILEIRIILNTIENINLVKFCIYYTDPKGVYAAMNFGLTKCDAEWIAILNHDDYYDTNILNFVFSNDLSNYSYLYGRVRFLKDDLQLEFGCEAHNQSINFKLNHLHPACIVKRDVYSKFGNFDTRLKIEADLDFLARIRHLPGKFIPHVLTNYTAGGLSSREAMRIKNIFYIALLNKLPMKWTLNQIIVFLKYKIYKYVHNS
jgi:hypothetical protein